MKKLIFPLLFLFLMACSDDDGGSSTNPNIDLVVGTWNLTTLQINPAQDVNEDGNTTTNVLDELPCMNGRITFRADNTWSFQGTDLVITTITGGLFKFFCGDPLSEGGNWDVQGNNVRLVNSTGVLTQFSLNADELTISNIIGETLPGLQAEVYTKQ